MNKARWRLGLPANALTLCLCTMLLQYICTAYLYISFSAVVAAKYMGYSSVCIVRQEVVSRSVPENMVSSVSYLTCVQSLGCAENRKNDDSSWPLYEQRWTSTKAPFLVPARIRSGCTCLLVRDRFLFGCPPLVNAIYTARQTLCSPRAPARCMKYSERANDPVGDAAVGNESASGCHSWRTCTMLGIKVSGKQL